MKIKGIIALLLFALVLFHKPLIGQAVRWTLWRQYNCQLAYQSLKWEKKELVFSNLVLFDPTFNVHVGRAAIRFDWGAFPKKIKGHLTIDRPHLSLQRQREWKKGANRWLDLTASVNDGTLEWEGLAHFSGTYSEAKSQFSLDWGESGLIATIYPDKIEADLRRFRAPLLQPFIPVCALRQGFLSGRISVGLDRELLSAHLQIDQMAIAIPLGAVEQVAGAVSYHASLGAKWDLKGFGRAQEQTFPFTCEGRTFFQSDWLASTIQWEGASCQVAKKEEAWTFACDPIPAAQVTWLQACAALFVPELTAWTLQEGHLRGKALFSPHRWTLQFEATDVLLKKGTFEFSCQKSEGDLNQEGGSLVLADQQFHLKAAGIWNDWRADVRLFSGTCALHGGWEGDACFVQLENGQWEDVHFVGEGWIDPQFDFSLELQGDWTVLQKKIPFRCSQFSKKGKEWAFDFRLERKMWDILRLVGTSNGREIFFDSKSHLLGTPLHFAHCERGLIDVHLCLPWKSLSAAAGALQEWGLDLEKVPFFGDTNIHFQYKRGFSDLTALGTSVPFEFHVEEFGNGWKLDLASHLTLHALLQKDGMVKGTGKWEAFDLEFEGKVAPSLRCEFSLPKMRIDLGQLAAFNLEGTLEGQGHLVYDGGIESDFDWVASGLKIHSYPLENEGPIHLSYSSNKGALFRGIDLHGPFDCIVDLLEYDACRSHWIFHKAQVHLPASFLTHRFLQFLDKERDLNFTADLDFNSDFSTFVCTMSEGSIPFKGATHYVEHLHLFWDHGECKAALHYLDYLHRLRFNMDDEAIAGRLIIGEEELPLTIDWEYRDALRIHAIEGSFGGLEASFHAESSDTLIGSARLNLTELSRFLPAGLVEVFDELKMGKGYELKGRVKFDHNIPSFRGILSGKQVELFGFQFRTLLAQAELGHDRVRIYDVKISDSAGMMKIDEIFLQGKEGTPWTIAVPRLTMVDFRPSLLQRPGKSLGPIDPIVVRECTLTDFQGLLDESTTYTAKGKLHFINSYKREETVFDLPVNVLSRIVGLDLELLVPVCGDLDFELKDGFFHLTELTNAFSEGKRSEFFLEMEPLPTMDLDGNLNIRIKMKQFVLFKLTESFLISVEGKLEDPQFHLRKKRFFGLM